METESFKEPEFKMSAFFEMTPDLVCIAGRNGFFKKVNRSVIEKLGYTEKELMASPISSFIHPEDRQFTSHKRAELLNGKPLLNFQNRYLAKSGAVLWLEWTSVYFPDNEVVFAIAKDITERKQIEIEIEEKYRKYKNLTSHFKSSIEEDRKSLANELHEELAQLASVLKTDIEWIKNSAVELTPPARGRIEHASLMSQLLIKTIRRISFSISPNMLEHLGLNATLEWYCKEFSVLNGIPCHFESAYDKANLTDEIRIDLFRICQEALMNILNHAQASHVKITIEEVGDQIRLTILDDGKGFDVEPQKWKPGLIRMRERAASINGQLTIRSEAGKGTSVMVSIARQ
ncbi:MAG TPA: PAS domain-containing sensor histidine kinase [Puia sp.]|nr:PAS domain-containing sensor histidine kinase [Puia sp.]